MFFRSRLTSAEALLSGPRIVELGKLAADLEKGCTSCCLPLRLAHCTAENKQGLASLLHLTCDECGAENRIITSKTHYANPGPSKHVGRPAFDAGVNTKAVLGMINAGVGATHLNFILSTMNIPLVHHTTLKRREKEIGGHIEHAAKRSCTEAVLLERDQAMRTSMETKATEKASDLCIACNADLPQVVLR